MERMGFAELRAFLLERLVRDVMPFWTRHAIDWRNGGLFGCLDDAGAVRSRDKHMLSQTRALWTFSALVNRVEDREEWRRAAENQFRFVKRCGRDGDGRWVYVVDENGGVITGENSIVVDAFAIYGLVEYFRMSGDDEALKIARETYESVCERLRRPGTYKTAPYPTPPGMRAQREAMQFSLVFCELGRALGDERILAEGLAFGMHVLDCFYRADRDVLLEYVGLDNTPRDTPAGRAMVPGHGIESLWFQIRNFTLAGDADRARRAAQAMRCCFERGWDPVYGGLFLGIDVDGREPRYWKFGEYKRWWPHTEALCGALLAYEQLREDWCLAWYWRTHEWAWAHFPDRDHGEWVQNLDREGRRIEAGSEASAGGRAIMKDFPLKDPFHLPRALMVAAETLERLENTER